jgi:hypothetical protein
MPKIALTLDGNLHARFFIEMGRPIIPIPPPSGSLTYDDFESYNENDLLEGLNKGTNEWNNITPLAAYFAPEAYLGIRDKDDFELYIENTIVTSSNMIQGGTGDWLNTTVYYGYDNVWSYTHDSFVYYPEGGLLNNTGSYIENTTRRKWTGDWITKETNTGIQSWDNFTLYTTSTILSGSGETPDSRWPWNGNWDTRNLT